MAATLPTWLALNGGGFDALFSHEISLVLWWSLAVGFAVGVLPRGSLDRDLIFPAIAFAGLIVWTVLSFGWTESDERTWPSSRGCSATPGSSCSPGPLNSYTFRAAAAGTLSTAFAGGLGIAVASRLTPATFPGVDEPAVTSAPTASTIPLDYWNAVAAWGAIASRSALCWSAHARHRAGPSGRRSPPSRSAGLAVYLSYSRGGVVAMRRGGRRVIVLSRNRWTAFIHVLAAGAEPARRSLACGHATIADATGGAGGAKSRGALSRRGRLRRRRCLTSIARSLTGARLPLTAARWAVPGVLGVRAGGRPGRRAGLASEAWDEFRYEDERVARRSRAERLTNAGGNRNDLWASAIDAFEADPSTGIGPGSFEFWWSRDGRLEEPVVDATPSTSRRWPSWAWSAWPCCSRP